MSDVSYASSEASEVSTMIAQRLIQEYGSWEAPKIAAAIFEETVREIEQDLGTASSRVHGNGEQQTVASSEKQP